MRSPRLGLILATWTLSIGSLACSDSKPATPTQQAGASGAGAGGAGGGQGGGGGVAQGGAGGGGAIDSGIREVMIPPASACSVPCVANLTRDCVPMGMCTEQTTGFANSNRCYTNQVKIITAIVPAAPPMPTVLGMTTKKPDGSVCYTIDAQIAGAAIMMTFKNSAGVAVGTGTYDIGTMQPSITCDGQTYAPAQVASCAGVLQLPAVPGIPGSGGNCQPGTCAP